MLFTEIKNGTDKKKLKHNKHWVQTKPGLNNDAKKKTTSLQKDNIVKVMFMRFIEAASASNLGSYIKMLASMKAFLYCGTFCTIKFQKASRHKQK